MPSSEDKCNKMTIWLNRFSFNKFNSTKWKVSQTIFDFIKSGKVEELELCVKRGASINEVDKSRDKFTPLHYASYYGSLEVFYYFKIKPDSSHYLMI